MGLLNGTFEALFEYFSLDKLLTSNPKNLIRALLKQGGVEASEEFNTTFANNVADILVMAEKSDYQLKIKAYMESGMSREEAAKQALLDKCIELGWDAVGGFFSGGISGSISTKVSGINSSRGAQTQEPTQAQAQGMTAALQDQAPQPGTEQKNSARSQAENKSNKGESVRVVERLKEKIPEISDMHPVAKTSSDAVISYNGQTMAEKARALYEKIKGVVIRPNFGDVEINGRSVKDDLSHGIGVAKASVIPAIPQVIQNGRQIDFQSEWKGRAYDGYVFAAPVVLDGRTTYVAAVVKKTSKNRFYLHEVVDSDGNIIKINDGEKANPTSLAPVDDAGTLPPSQREAVASNNSIAQNGENSNGNPQPSTETGNTGEHSGKGAPLGGAVERSETEGGTTAAEAAANTDPAAAARQQQYQMEITAALRAGDYQLALKRFKEFGNPNLRALNDFQTLKAFTEFANAAGYGVSTVVTNEQPSIVQKKPKHKNCLKTRQIVVQ